MGLRMRKSITLGKGVKVNFGTKGASLSFGIKGLRQTIHTSGRRTTSIGIPGSGLSYVKTASGPLFKNNQAEKSAGNKQSNTSRKQANTGSNASPTPYEAQVLDYENHIATITSLHKNSDEEIHWNEIKDTKKPFEFMHGPRQTQATLALEQYKPTMLEKLIPAKAQKTKDQLTRAIEQAAAEEKQEYEEWNHMLLLANSVLKGDIDAYFEVLKEMKPLDDLLDYIGDIEYGSNESTTMEVEYRVKYDEVVPTYVISLTPTGKVSKKELTKTAYFTIVQDYVASSAIRIARDLFAHLPLQTVVIHAMEHSVNSATGHEEENTIISIVFDRSILYSLNFDNIDPSSALTNFNHNMKFLKTTGFKPVERMTPKQ